MLTANLGWESRSKINYPYFKLIYYIRSLRSRGWKFFKVLLKILQFANNNDSSVELAVNVVFSAGWIMHKGIIYFNNIFVLGLLH